MAKANDFPASLKHFSKLLNGFYGYHDYDVFYDFIDFSVACLLWKGDPHTADRLKKKYGNKFHLLGEMYIAMIHTMNDNIHTDQCWFDVPGTLYESFAMKSKSSALGQFFTPALVCDMIAKIQGADAPVGKLVNDPAAGSSRMLLAFNSVAPGNILIAQDIDQICTKMSAINLCLHGCKGQSVNGDALQPDNFNFGFSINPFQNQIGPIPHMIPISQDQSIAFKIWQKHLISASDEMPKVSIPSQKTPSQLSLFDA